VSKSPDDRRKQSRREFIGTALALSAAIAARPSLAARPAAAGDQPPAFDRLGAKALEAEVCVIGSGPAGAILAKTLVDRGIRTLLVESGADLARPGDAIDTDPLDAYSSRGEIDYPLAKTRFRGTGGTSNLWTGNCPRFHPIDFEPNACTPPGAPWPIRYADLESYYLRAEQELQVCGIENQPFAPPRRDPFPRRLMPHTPNIDRLLAACEADIAPQHMPGSDSAGAPVNVGESHLPAFRVSPHGTLVCGATATALLTDAGGRIVGMRLQAAGKPARTARAQLYVVACGGVESARLLLLSRGPAFPSGIGNHADLVGRGFMEHASAAIGSGTVRGLWNPRSGRETVFSERYVADAKEMGLGGVRLRLRLSRDRIDLEMSRPWDAVWRTLRALRQLEVNLKAAIEMEPSPENRIALDDRRRDVFGNPGAAVFLRPTERDRRTMRFGEELVRRLLPQLGAEDIRVAVGLSDFEHHHMGTCRMGDDPRTSVIDRNLCVHGCDNLYVAGSAAFVTGSVSNPTLTLVALSLRLADHLSERLRGAAFGGSVAGAARYVYS
jgi:choline dehydrogenase-like flavoprotein